MGAEGRRVLVHNRGKVAASNPSLPLMRTSPPGAVEHGLSTGNNDGSTALSETNPSRSNAEIEFALPAVSPVEGLSPLLGYIVRLYQIAYGLVGEDRNVAHVFLTAETRHLQRKDRRHILPSGEWGVGKSKLLKTVLKPVWSDVELLTRLTGPGLDRETASYDGKILLLEQVVGREPVELSFLMSEGELAIRSAERDEKTGKMVSKVNRVKGLPVVMSTLTGANVDSQFLSRVSTLAIDESDKQTQRIVKKKLEEWATVNRHDPTLAAGPVTSIDSKCRDLGPRVVQVVAPFATKLNVFLPSETGQEGIPALKSMRRGMDKISSLVNAIAFVKASLHLRPVIRVKLAKGVEDDVYVVALPEDLADAVYCLGAEQIIESSSYFFGRSKEIYNWLNESKESKTSREVAVGLKLSQNRAREYLNTLVELGHATRNKVSGTFYYEAIAGSEPQVKLETSFTDQELLEWFSKNFHQEARLIIPGPKPSQEVVVVGSP